MNTMNVVIAANGWHYE